MRLLFDENLAARLVTVTADVFPDSTHVLAPGLGGADDRAIWERARADGLVIVTKDDDFHRLTVQFGPPPKIIWIRFGNCATEEIAQLLRLLRDDIEAFAEDSEAGFLALG